MIDDKTEVWETVQEMNRCWTVGDPNGLETYFHKEIIAVTPNDPMPLLGRKACLAAWKSFTEIATIDDWQELEPKIQLFGDAAVVSYLYVLNCKVGEAKLSLEGRDLLFLVKEEGRWWVVADQFSPVPKPGADVV